ncbi:hypothetical protein AB834_01910 [PVC group bacterium (ex Bugula neritina AB1)]|nr:hypothetical protein AB834_01910 [PVC group bacterium (ex Bugula neritina AB1)]
MKIFIYLTFKSNNVHCVIQNSLGVSYFISSVNIKDSQSSKIFLRKLSSFFQSIRQTSPFVCVVIYGFSSYKFLFLQSFINIMPRYLSFNYVFSFQSSFNGCRLQKERRL